MRKTRLCAIFLFGSLFLASCNNKDDSLTISDLTRNTLLINAEGNLQEGIVEDFNKSYYEKTNLEEYIEDQIEDYNLVNGKNSVKKVSLSINSKKAKLILKYKDFKDYVKFNDTTASYLTATQAKESNLLPEQYIDAKDSAQVDKDTALKGDNYKVLIISDPYNVEVSGKVLYYYNAALLNSKTVQALEDDDYSVIIYEP